MPTLTIDGQTYEVANTGPDFLIFRDPVTLPHQEAVLSLVVDGKTRSYAVWIYGCENALQVQCTRLGTDEPLTEVLIDAKTRQLDRR